MDRQRQKAIDSPEFNKNQNKVRCQSCDKLQPIPKLNNDNKQSSSSMSIQSTTCTRIRSLQSMINTAERYHPDGSTCKKEKEELKQILEDEKKRDMLMRLPLHSCALTGYKYVCGQCYDNLYLSVRVLKKKESSSSMTVKHTKEQS